MTLSRTGVDGEREFQRHAGWFGLGWACADEAHLPALAQALGELLRAAETRIGIHRPDGTALLAAEWRSSARARDASALEEALPLGGRLTLHVMAWPAEDSPLHDGAWREALVLMQQGLACILVAQNDRLTLAGLFPELSDREWQVCLALQGPGGEKQIAHELACSRHTVHSYVKGVYRKLRVRSRLAVLEHLRKSREAVRCAAVSGFGAEETVPSPTG